MSVSPIRALPFATTTATATAAAATTTTYHVRTPLGDVPGALAGVDGLSIRYVNVDPDLPAIPTGRHGVMTLQGVGGGGDDEHIYGNESVVAGYDGFCDGGRANVSLPEGSYGDSGGLRNGALTGGAGASGTVVYGTATAPKGYEGFEINGAYDTFDNGMGGRHTVGQGQEEYTVPAMKKNRKDKRSKAKSARAEASAEPQGYTQVDPDKKTNRRAKKKGSVAVRMPMHFASSFVFSRPARSLACVYVYVGTPPPHDPDPYAGRVKDA